MPIELKMPALSPTMEEGTLAKWLVKEGDAVKSGDILAEIETDKATMEFEAVDEGTIAKILVPEGTDGVKVGQPIAILAGEGEDASAAVSAPPPSAGEGKPSAARQGEGAPKPDKPTGSAPSSQPSPPRGEGVEAAPAPKESATPKAPPPQAPVETPAAPPQPAAPPRIEGERIKASPLARRLAEAQGIDLSKIQGSGPGGRIVRADLGKAAGGAAAAPATGVPAAPHVVTPGPFEVEIPHEVV
jgi:pyruvate dehydrogenase E2 component (dihydrolipoamide acetyltransferase)